VHLDLTEVIAAIGDGELVPHYQPLVSFQSGRVVGVEALARWERPGAGRISPGAFVPCLEEARRATDLSSWMIDRACADLDRWRASFSLPAGFSVAVNVSATELVDHRLVRLVAEALQRYRLAAAGLCLELTETTAVEDYGRAAAVMTELRSLGTRLALDDFGAGAATPEVLERLPFDMVKIDRSYAASLGSADSCAFIADVVALAERRRLEVVAEGIETAEQFAALRSLGCRRGQGFGLGRPQPADVVLATWAPGLAAL
jgi:EAL domain-containing protein (putative c-di-GMP-specific phosphodiesterase class I)